MGKSAIYIRIFVAVSLLGGIGLFFLLRNESNFILWLLPYIGFILISYYWIEHSLIGPLQKLVELSTYDPTGRKISNIETTTAGVEITRLHSNFDRLYQQMADEITKTKDARATEQRTMARLNALVDNVSLSIITIDTEGLVKDFNPATPALFNQQPEQLMDVHINQLIPRLNINGGLFRQILNAGVDIELDAMAGETVKPVELSAIELSIKDDDPQYILLLHDISQRKNYEDRLRNLNQRLINTSRQAGIAEIATSILHNVGNVLNSVNTSVAMLRQNLDKNQIEGLRKSLQMLNEQGPALFQADGKGPQVLEYLGALATQLEDAKQDNIKELSQLKQNIKHIAEIVSAQQKFVCKSGVIEELNIAQLIEEALSINAVSMENNQVEIERDFEPVIEFKGERSKIVQILVNLIRNANEAMMQPQSSGPKITISADIVEQNLIVNVQDSGEGISQANMTNMFRYGFTTKSDGHGFGLHSCALAAQEMQGKLKAYSDGEGQGARFELTLPLEPNPTAEHAIEINYG